MSLPVGTAAPAFELISQNREPVSLDDLKGKKSLIVFIPFPFTGICDDEGCAIRDGLGGLEQLDANVVVITAHAVPVTAKWASEFGFEFPILADYWPHAAVIQAYDAFNEEKGAANRVSYVLDADGIITDVIETEALSIAREFEAYGKALA